MPESSFILSLVLQSALIPFGVTAALLIALRKPAMALAAGFLASYFTVFHAQWSPLPHQALDWLPWIALIGTVVAIVSEHLPAARLPLRAILALAAPAVIVWPALASLGAAKFVAAIVVSAILILAAWSWLASSAPSRPTPAPLLMVVAGGMALTMMIDASQAIGQSSGALASALVACVVLNLLPRLRVEFNGAAVGVAVLLFGALLINAWLYASLSPLYVALLAGGLLADPIIAGINRLRGTQGGLVAWLFTVVLAGLPVLAAIALAVKAAQDAGGY